MRVRIALLAALAASLFAGSAFAAASLSDVVQKGAAADKLKEKNQINLTTAKALGDHCINEAAGRGLAVSVVILDQFGVITYYVRADGQNKVNTETALMKAKTVLNTRGPSKAVMNAVRSGNQSEARAIYFGNFANSGALPIVVDGQFLGAIGVGGSAPRPPEWSDEICAQHALEAVIGPQPALLPDLPNPNANANAGGRGRGNNGAPNQ
jgi:uncharacterized protein GlcG (DUF336 family)